MESLSKLIDLTGKRALVTGGGKGIGAAISTRLRETGADVTIADLDPAAVATAEEIGAAFVACDITDHHQLKQAVDTAAGNAGLDILINNAGIYPITGPVDKVSDEFISRMLDVNVRAQFSATREAAARMRNGGSVVNIASTAGLRGGANISAYSASKGAVISMTRAHANELGPQGIRVNAIAPGIINTPGVQAQMEPLRQRGIDVDEKIAANPVGIAGHPDHIAGGVVFLACDLAAFVTGHVLVIDGGSTA